jgi:hypothetical protein
VKKKRCLGEKQRRGNSYDNDMKKGCKTTNTTAAMINDTFEFYFVKMRRKKTLKQQKQTFMTVFT